MVKNTDEAIENILEENDLSMSNDQDVTRPEPTNNREESEQVLRTEEWLREQRKLQSLVKLPVYDKNDKTYTPFIEEALYFEDGRIATVDGKNITVKHPAVIQNKNGGLVLQSQQGTHIPVLYYRRVEHMHYTDHITKAMFNSECEPILINGKMITNKHPQIVKVNTLGNPCLVMYAGQGNQYIVPGLINYNTKKQRITAAKKAKKKIVSQTTLENTLAPDQNTIQNNHPVTQDLATNTSPTGNTVLGKTPSANQPPFLFTNKEDLARSTNMQTNAMVVTEFGSLNPPTSSSSITSTVTHKTTQTTTDSVRLTEGVAPNIGDTDKSTIMEDTSKASTESLSTSTFSLANTKTQKGISPTLPIYDVNEKEYTQLIEKALYFEDGRVVKVNEKNITADHPTIIKNMNGDLVLQSQNGTQIPVFRYEKVEYLHYTKRQKEAMFDSNFNPILINGKMITIKHPQIFKSGGTLLQPKLHVLMYPGQNNQYIISDLLTHNNKRQIIFRSKKTANKQISLQTTSAISPTEMIIENTYDTSKPPSGFINNSDPALLTNMKPYADSSKSLSNPTYSHANKKKKNTGITPTLPIYNENEKEYTPLIEEALYFEDGSVVKMNGKNISKLHPQIQTENGKIFFVNNDTSIPVFDYSSMNSLHYSLLITKSMVFEDGKPIILNDKYITKKHPQIISTGKGRKSSYFFVSKPGTPNQELVSNIITYNHKKNKNYHERIKSAANQEITNMIGEEVPLQSIQQIAAVLALEPTVSTPENEPIKRKQLDNTDNEKERQQKKRLKTLDKDMGNTPESTDHAQKDNRPTYPGLFNNQLNDQNQKSTEYITEYNMVEDQPLAMPPSYLNDQALNEVDAKPGLKVSPTSRLLAFFGLVNDHKIDQEDRDQKLIDIERIKQNQIEAFKTHGRKKVIKIESIELEFVVKEFNDFCDLYQNAVAILKNNNQLISILEDNNENIVNVSIANDIVLALTILNQCYEIGTSILRKLNDHHKYNIDIERKDLDNAIGICNNNMFIVAHTISQAIEGVCKIKDNAERKSFTKVKSLKQSKKAGKHKQAKTNVMVETDSLSKTNIAMRLYQEEIDQRKECLNRKAAAFFTKTLDSMRVVFNPITKDPSGPIDLYHRICAKIMFSVLDQKQVESYINHICQLVFSQDIKTTNETQYVPNNNNSDPKSVGRRAKS